ncbi:MAG: hypothetical protein NT107_07205 [Planctomycetota bacterium]|nr:hypothetical protein [Planctomycetota bacterium]
MDAQVEQLPAVYPDAVERRRISPAALVIWLLLALLALSVWIPITSGRRTARAEGRGEAITGILLAVAEEMQPIDFSDRGLPYLLFGRVIASGISLGVFVDDLLPATFESKNAVTLINKHYCFQLRWSEPADQQAIAMHDDKVPPLEALGWPLENTGPAHAAFFAPEDAEASYSRNLVADYVGTESKYWPIPGQQHRRPDASSQPSHYRSFDDERWLLLSRTRQAAGK